MILKSMKEGRLMVLAVIVLITLSGCGVLSNSGPSRGAIQEGGGSDRLSGIQVVDVNDNVVRKLAESNQHGRFGALFPSNGSNNYLIGPGDIVEVTIWEAPPAMLFGGRDSTTVGATSTTSVTLPEQMVASDGSISIPFVGRVTVHGDTTEEIEATLVKDLRGKANQPQVLVRVVKNNSSSVTIVGEVNSSTMMPLTPRGERLLDAIAAGGGVKKEVDLTAVRLSRKNVTGMMPLGSVISDPKQNILLAPGDVVTAVYQPQTFSILGQTGKNAEIPFEAQGISLAQALARSGGLDENRADASGIFVFRFEDGNTFNSFGKAVASANGTVPAVYNIDLSDPASFFLTQNFPVRNHDVIYVATSGSRQTEKFVRLLLLFTSPAAAVNNLAQ
jgi:polysaccharide export outer membrane protein